MWILLLTYTSNSIPNLASSASSRLTVTVYKNSSIRTNTVVSVGVKVRSSSASSSSHTESSIPECASRTFTNKWVHIPFSSIQARIDFTARETVPSGSHWALAHFGVRIVNSAQSTVDTDSSSPVSSDWAFTLVVLNIESLTYRTEFDAVASIPIISVSTSDAGFLNGWVRSRRTYINAHSVIGKLISRTTSTFRSDEEQILERKVLNLTSALAQIEGEVRASPSSGETDVLELVVDNKASQTEDTGIVATNAGCRSVNDISNWSRWFESEVPVNKIQARSYPSNVTDVKSVDLSDSCGCYQNSDTWSVGVWLCDLDLEWRHDVSCVPLRTDFETVEEYSMVNHSLLLTNSFEWENDLDAFASIATS